MARSIWPSGPNRVGKTLWTTDPDESIARVTASDPIVSTDNYPHVIARLTERWRVADSREPLAFRQWLLQQKTNPNRWRGRSFCQTRLGLESAIAMKVGREHVGKIADLPVRIDP